MSVRNCANIGLVFFPAFDWAISPTHPEREERLLYTYDQIAEEGILDLAGIREFRPWPALDEHIERAHVCVPGASSACPDPHRIAAGGCMAASDLVMSGEVTRAFALMRPPGHHAMTCVHGSRGFCTVNNEAIMVEHMRSRRRNLRIAIVDTDAHHADGTQDIFFNDPDVLHISIHQDGRTLYPGTGFIGERGGPGAFGNTINVPLPPGTGDAGLLYVIEHLVMPILADWKPDYIINAAGQDNHVSDPLTNMCVTAYGYAELTRLLAPDIVVLEGGYSIEGALPYVNLGILLALAGLNTSRVRGPGADSSPPPQPVEVTREIAHTVDLLMHMWATRGETPREELFGSGPFYTRRRRIYYDTDSIDEVQVDQVRLCDACPGWRHIASRAHLLQSGAEQSIAASILPRRACARCRAEARAQHERDRHSPDFGHSYFRDPDFDTVESA